jgi:hypothetical protein
MLLWLQTIQFILILIALTKNDFDTVRSLLSGCLVVSILLIMGIYFETNEEFKDNKH